MIFELYKQTLFHTVLSEIPWVLQKEEEELVEEREWAAFNTTPASTALDVQWSDLPNFELKLWFARWL